MVELIRLERIDDVTHCVRSGRHAEYILPVMHDSGGLHFGQTTTMLKQGRIDHVAKTAAKKIFATIGGDMSGPQI